MTDKAPVIVPLSELRRDASRLIMQMERSHLPLFITQRGWVTAVMLSRVEYDAMCALRDKGMRAINPRVVFGDQRSDADTEDRLLSVREVTDEPGYWDEW